MKFNEFIGIETLSREYKEFSFHKTGFSLDEQAELYCESNFFDFDELVYSNLDKYLEQYVPKYISGFWNAGINGDLFIGTDDYGMVKGVPLSIGKSLDPHLITEKVRNIIRTHIKKDEKFDFEYEIQVELIPVSKPDPIAEIHPDYVVYQTRKTEFLKEYQLFLTQYKAWQDTYEMVNMKLVDIVAHLHYRNVLIDYINQSIFRNQTAIDCLLDPEYQLPSMSGEEIKDLKLDPSCVFYWVTNLKDELSVGYKKDKPYFFPKFKHRYLPTNLIVGLELIPYWKNIHLYLIRISSGNNKGQFSYLNNHQWTQCNRIVQPGSNQPMCIPF